MKLLFFFSCLLVFVSCSKDFLNTHPTDQLGDQEALSTQENVYAALNGIYRKMVEQYMGNQSCGGEPSVCIMRDCLGEDVVIPNTSNGYYVTGARWLDHRSSSSVWDEFAFQFYYYLNLQTNLILEAIGDSGPFRIPVRDTVQMYGIRGEAYCLRAWCHFQLVQLYAGRYVNGENNSQAGISYRRTSDSSPMCRHSVEECYQAIHEDLDSSFRNLEGYIPVSVTHVSQKVAYALKARVYLTQQKYSGSAYYAELAIREAEREGYGVMEREKCLNGFSKLISQTRETLWGANTQDDQTVAFYSFYAFMSWNFNSGAIRNSPRCINSGLYQKLSDGDIRRKWWDPTGELAGPASAYKRIAYQNRKFEVTNTSVSAGDYAYVRMSELYLMKAEALARSGLETEAAETLRDFVVSRDERYPLSANRGAALIDEIMIHRRLELWGEGFRFTDLKRLNCALDRKGTNYPSAVASVMEVAAGDARWQWLIPDAEIDAAMGLVEQND